MANYILRNIDPDLWARFKTRSEEDGIPMRALMLLLIDAYINGKVSVVARKSQS
jgi:hypothetical protein